MKESGKQWKRKWQNTLNPEMPKFKQRNDDWQELKANNLSKKYDEKNEIAATTSKVGQSKFHVLVEGQIPQ